MSLVFVDMSSRKLCVFSDIWVGIDEGEVRGHLDKVVQGTVEETLNALLDEEADRMCFAQRYE